MTRCVFVAQARGPHTKRWVAALRGIDVNVHDIYREEFRSDEAFFVAVDAEQRHSDLTIAGPLSLAKRLENPFIPTVLLSWGFDLQEAAADLDLQRFALVLVDSKANSAIAQTAGAENVHLIPWGIDLASLDSDTTVTDLTDFGIAPNERVVLSLRAHEERYRVADIIEAFAKQPRNERLAVGNTGSLTPNLKKLADRLHVDVTFLPAVDESEIPGLLRRASVYISASRVDGTSVTLLQAMACQIPIVASANPGNLDWIEDGVTGFLFPIADIERLNSALTRALVHDSSVTIRARAEVERRADWQQNIHQLIPLLTKQRQPPQSRYG